MEKESQSAGFLLERADYDDLEPLKQGSVYNVTEVFGKSNSPLLSVLPAPNLRMQRLDIHDIAGLVRFATKMGLVSISN